jgi:glycopeptide antibiotics resistance protein
MLRYGRPFAVAALLSWLAGVLVATMAPMGAPMQPNLVPLAGIIGTFADRGFWFGIGQLAGNLLLLAPVGFLLPVAWPSLGWRGVLLACLALTVGIEVTQWLMGAGRQADIDDVWLNVAGAAAGFDLRHRYVAWAATR